jgi:hypothetical protein
MRRTLADLLSNAALAAFAAANAEDVADRPATQRLAAARPPSPASAADAVPQRGSFLSLLA